MDPEAARELDVWRADLAHGAIDDPAETRARLDQYERGESQIVRLRVFTDVAVQSRLRRYDGMFIGGCWFERGQDHQNRQHARELIRDHLDDVVADLQGKGVTAAVDELATVPIMLEFDPDLERRL